MQVVHAEAEAHVLQLAAQAVGVTVERKYPSNTVEQDSVATSSVHALHPVNVFATQLLSDFSQKPLAHFLQTFVAAASIFIQLAIVDLKQVVAATSK